MKLKDIDKKLAEIEAKAHDPEVAHALEDDLYVAVLTAIGHPSRLRDGSASAQALAARALQARNIKFPRWSA